MSAQLVGALKTLVGVERRFFEKADDALVHAESATWIVTFVQLRA